MANKTLNNVKINMTLKSTNTRAQLSTSSEDLAVQMGKINKWYESLVPTGGETGNILGWNSDGTAKWVTVAPSANKLNISSAVGETSQPVYFKADGTPEAISFTIEKSVPSNAVFTDQNVKSTLLAQSTAEASYRPTFVTGAATGGVYIIDSYKVNHTPGTTSAVGNMRLVLGNATASGTANNEEGQLKLYSPGTSFHTLKGTTVSSEVIHVLPSTGGTILNTGTTSYTQTSSSSATGAYEIGKIKINGTTTTIYGHDVDTKVTSSANHYTPATESGSDKSASASGATAAWSIDVVKGVTLNTDGKGHVTGISVTSGKIPANPVPSNNVTGSGTSGYLTKWNGTNTITNGPQLGSSTTTFLRNDGTWATPTDTDTKVKVASNTTSKAYLIATTTAPAGTAVEGVGDANVYMSATDHYLTAPGFSTTATNKGYYAYDSTSTRYALIFDNGSNLWIGTDMSVHYPHNGQTFISTGWTGTLPTSEGTLTGYDTIRISVPKYTVPSGSTTGTWDHTNYYALHTGNTSFTQTLSSGTKIGTIKINGTSTDIYCETNTNTDTKVNVTLATTTKAYLLGTSTTPTATAQAVTSLADTGVYLDTTAGGLCATNVKASSTLCANTANSNNAGGIALYGTDPTVYGIMFRGTTNSGKHGYVQSDWATYLTMNDGGTTRGWVFRRGTTNVASISGAGNAVFNGSVTVGGNSTNTSGCRMQYNSTTQTLDFVFG